jgi:hypothetical protein
MSEPNLMGDARHCGSASPQNLGNCNNSPKTIFLIYELIIN